MEMPTMPNTPFEADMIVDKCDCGTNTAAINNAMNTIEIVTFMAYTRG